MNMEIYLIGAIIICVLHYIVICLNLELKFSKHDMLIFGMNMTTDKFWILFLGVWVAVCMGLCWPVILPLAAIYTVIRILVMLLKFKSKEKK